MQYHRDQPQSVLEYPNHKVYYYMTITTDRPIHNNRPYKVVPDRPSNKHTSHT